MLKKLGSLFSVSLFSSSLLSPSLLTLSLFSLSLLSLSLLSLSLLFLSPILGYAQVWQEWAVTYNGPAGQIDGGYDICTDNQSNVYVTGYCNYGFSITMGSDYATIKYDSSGNQLWVATYDGPGHDYDEAKAIGVDANGNVYVTGWSHGGIGLENYDYATIKYNSDGIQQWVARYNGPAGGDDRAVALALDDNANIYVTGYTTGLNTEEDFCTIKYDSNGVQQWVAWYNGPSSNDDRAAAIARDPLGNIYVTGRSWGTGTEYDYATIKYNALGVQQWVSRITYAHDDVPCDIAADASGNAYVTGWVWNSGGTSDNIATVKYDTWGNQQWLEIYNGLGNGVDFGMCIEADDLGNVYVAGYSDGSIYPGSYDFDYATIKYDATGQELWVSRYNGPGDYDDELRDMTLDEAGNIYVTGICDADGIDYATVKYNSAGLQQWVALYDGPNGSDEARAIALDANGNVYVTGGAFETTVWLGLDVETVKYGQDTFPTLALCVEPVNPPITIPATGGFFDFDVTITNNSDTLQNFDIWTMVQAPNGFWIGPIFGPYNITLPANTSITRTRTQYVPAFAPTGTYLYECRAGDYLQSLWAVDNFEFVKQPGNDATIRGDKPLKNGWDNYGERF